MDRILNYTFSFILIYLFIAEGQANDHLYILTALVLSIVLSFSAFFLNWTTIDALPAVTVIGTVTFGLAGWMMALPLLVFFISGSMLAVNREMITSYTEVTRENGTVAFRRNGSQVWANGFWLSLFVAAWFITETDLLLIAAMASLTAAMADTWATEIGQREGVTTVLASTLKKVPPGTEGGVSLRGVAGALAGATFIGLIYLILTNLNNPANATVILLCGFAGSCFDSWLGAVLYKKVSGNSKLFPGYSDDVEVINNFINFAATGFGGITAFIILSFL